MRKQYTVSEHPNPKYFISWGCGVQSTTLCVMSVFGDIRKVDGIVTADTGWERSVTYQVRNWYINWLRERGMVVEIASNGNIKEDLYRTYKENTILPYWLAPSGAPMKRQCTGDYKIIPVRRKVRELLGLRQDNKGRLKKNTVIMYLGISTDEAQRMRDSDREWIKNEYPLIDLRMSRKDCVDYLISKGLPVPPKSACICCPYTDPQRWLDLKNNNPEEFNQAVEFDEMIRIPPERILKNGEPGLFYLYNKLEPLATAKFTDHIRDPKEDVCDTGYCFV